MKSNVEKLLIDINNKLIAWDKTSMFKLKGINDLSISDMDMLNLYAKHFQEKGSFEGLLEPRGSIKEVFDKYNIK